MQAFKESGLAEDTVTIVTADHGDMLGERGLWFKMNWFENSARVPLLVHAPARFRPRRVAAAVSLVDIMPTLLELAMEGAMLHEEVKGEGHSLVGHLSGAGGTDAVIGEYTAEGARAPLMMIRRGTLKFIHSPGDPDQLYDLEADPLERDNLAPAKAHAAQVESLRQECARRWRMDEISESVIASQRRRRYLNGILRTQNVSWDYEPPLDAKNQYIRNTVPIFELEMRSRFPPPK
jgi:choline-sulfatase